MSANEKRQRRIKAAQTLADLCESGQKVPNEDHRQAWVHDQIAEAVRDVCSKDGGGNHFNAAQVDCLTEIAFQVAFMVDPKNRRKSGFFGRLYAGWTESSFSDKFNIVGVMVAFLVAVSGGAVWLYSAYVDDEQVSENSEQASADRDTAPPEGKP